MPSPGRLRASASCPVRLGGYILYHSNEDVDDFEHRFTVAGGEPNPKIRAQRIGKLLLKNHMVHHRFGVYL